MNFSLRKFVAPEFVFGTGALDLAGRYAFNYGGEKVLVVTDPGVVAAGWSEKIIRSLDSAGISNVVFSRLTSNPKADEIMDGADFYLAQNCDLIIAVGGGSVMDCAKGIGIVSSNGGNILDYKGVDNVPFPGPPLICIPTTAGTSADVSQFAIINDDKERVKIAIISKTVVPDVALVDPSTTLTMEPYLTACTGIDALVHAIEAFVSLANSPIFDLHALEAIRLINNHLSDSLKNPDNLELREHMMLASLEAGLAFSNASLGAVHAMAHSLGGYLGLPHGECNAILLDHVIEFNYESSQNRYEKIATVMGIDLKNKTSSEKKKALLEHISNLKKSAGITATLKDRGASLNDISSLSEKAVQDPCLVTNPRHATKRDLEVIYENAF